MTANSLRVVQANFERLRDVVVDACCGLVSVSLGLLLHLRKQSYSLLLHHAQYVSLLLRFGSPAERHIFTQQGAHCVL